MSDPPSFAGGDQVRVTVVSPGAAARSRGAVGAMAAARGVASTISAVPGPTGSFSARTENVYERPFSRSLTTTDRASAVPPSSQPSSSTWYSYPVTSDPPSSSGGSQVSVTSVSPGDAARLRGADGAPRGVAFTDAVGPGPIRFTARIENVYSRPFSRLKKPSGPGSVAGSVSQFVAPPP